MKCNDSKKNEARYDPTNLDNLDSLDKALHELGMLSAITEVRRELLRENKNLNVMRLNTRYVSNVTVGYCMRRSAARSRLCPYVLPLRHRTKSESSDALAADPPDAADRIFEPSTSTCNSSFDLKSPTKRCQSLENLNLAAEPPEIEISPDMDCVSTRIQKLQVDE